MNNFTIDKDGIRWDERQMSEQAAIAFGTSDAWVEFSDEQKVRLQLFQHRLCIPIDEFCRSLSRCLDRPVFTHELAFGYKRLQDEFLGLREAPTLEDIINLVPKEQRVIFGANFSDTTE